MKRKIIIEHNLKTERFDFKTTGKWSVSDASDAILGCAGAYLYEVMKKTGIEEETILSAAKMAIKLAIAERKREEEHE